MKQKLSLYNESKGGDEIDHEDKYNCFKRKHKYSYKEEEEKEESFRRM